MMLLVRVALPAGGCWLISERVCLVPHAVHVFIKMPLFIRPELAEYVNIVIDRFPFGATI